VCARGQKIFPQREEKCLEGRRMNGEYKPVEANITAWGVEENIWA
jgi:hypothetical protein